MFIGIAYLAMEFCEVGNLLSYLRNSTHKFQNIKERSGRANERYDDDPTMILRFKLQYIYLSREMPPYINITW